MRLLQVALALCGVVLAGSPRRAAAAEVVTVSARRMLDVDSGQILPDPFIRIEGGVITQVRKRNLVRT